MTDKQTVKEFGFALVLIVGILFGLIVGLGTAISWLGSANGPLD